ncbi:hemerythrin domain-containing protein [Nonomuraea cypriaca]|uniref:hemerythrin domain-containing protein n=1 Tax=Nonomuraea cypriaca TaxID=1187855 RepID=UPI001F4811CB|nr:hemerythrin domain-containing protein [Nonomuraea cypriaca]
MVHAHHSVEEHKEAEVLLDALVRAKPGSAEFRTTLEQLVASVSHHIEEEESTILPALAKSAGKKGLQELGQAFKQRRAEELKALGPPGGSHDGPSKAELYERAQRADIPGRSHMGKEELADALRHTK